MGKEEKLAFESYFKTYYQQAFKYTVKKVSDVQAAEDLVMDAFVSCHQKFDEFDPERAKFATWLYVILNNKIKNYYRDKKEYESLDDYPELIAGEEKKAIWEENHKNKTYQKARRLQAQGTQLIKELSSHLNDLPKVRDDFPKAIEALEEAICCYQSILGWKDSGAQINECKKLEEQIRNSVYYKACGFGNLSEIRGKKKKYESATKAVEYFKLLGNYKESVGRLAFNLNYIEKQNENQPIEWMLVYVLFSLSFLLIVFAIAYATGMV